jgi:hypothetical protein
LVKNLIIKNITYFAEKSELLWRMEIKKTMYDKFEDLRDRELIVDYEKKLSAGKIKFETADNLILQIECKKIKA